MVLRGHVSEWRIWVVIVMVEHWCTEGESESESGGGRECNWVLGLGLWLMLCVRVGHAALTEINVCVQLNFT